MFELLATNPLEAIIWFIGLLLSISIHEFAHAWTADQLGDPTPRHQGRVTLNPLAHLDLLGTIALLLTRFGWGKPVEYDPYNLKNPVRDTALIAAAGPATNLIIALVLAVVMRFSGNDWVASIAFQLLFTNLVLAVFNLIPVYPLDGSKIITALLPRSTAMDYEEFMHRYGIFVLLLLVFPWLGGVSAVSVLVMPIVRLMASLLLGGVGI